MNAADTAHLEDLDDGRTAVGASLRVAMPQVGRARRVCCSFL
jgi:hypothetical protein